MRIIAAFDQLVLQHAEIGGIVRTAAAVAKCKAGLWDPVHSLFIHVGVDGRDIEDDRAVPTRAAYAPLEGTSGGEVWLERAGGPGPSMTSSSSEWRPRRWSCSNACTATLTSETAVA